MYRDDFAKSAHHGALHGDVGLVRISALPTSAKRTQGNKIALGEVTGHHHILDAPGVQLYECPASALDPAEVDVASLQALFGASTTVTVAEVATETPLRHQEHGTIIIAPGIYWVPRQYEFPLGRPQRVED